MSNYGNIFTQSYSGKVSNSTSDTSTTSTAPMSGITVTPPAGTYNVWFSTDVNSPTSGAVVSMGFYVAGTLTTDGQIKFMPFAGGTLTAGAQRMPVALNDQVTVNGSQAITVQWSSSTAGLTTASKRLTYSKVY